MKNSLVSVVLCTYNGERFITQQIDSILNQSYSPIELVISDDTSTDNTTQILKTYEHDLRVSIHYQTSNTGISQNFAFAASQTKGDYIAFADQDDIWLNDKIEKLVAHIGTHPLIYSNSLLVDENGNSMNKTLTSFRKMYTGTDSRCYILYSCVWGHGMLITRRLLQLSMPMPMRINHDIWIAFQAFLHGGIYYYDEVLTYYRQHSSSASTTIPKKLPMRKKAERHHAYLQQLYWIELMEQHEPFQYKLFYKRLIDLYKKKGTGMYVFGLLLFMIRHRKALFLLSRKNVASQLIEIVKQARSEKP